MTACICDNCYQLKETDQEDGTILCSCEHGFPDEACESCEGREDCTFTCEFYDPIQKTTVICAGCGKTMDIFSKPDDGPYYCADCYLKRETDASSDDE